MSESTDGVTVEQNGDETAVEGPNASDQDIPTGTDSEYDKGAARTKDEGVTIKGKVEEDNDDGPRSKASLTIKGTGRDAEQAIKDYTAAADYAKENQLLKELHEMRHQVRSPGAAD